MSFHQLITETVILYQQITLRFELLGFDSTGVGGGFDSTGVDGGLDSTGVGGGLDLVCCC